MQRDLKIVNKRGERDGPRRLFWADAIGSEDVKEAWLADEIPGSYGLAGQRLDEEIRFAKIYLSFIFS